MKNILIALATITVLAPLAACGPEKSAKEQVDHQVSKVYALNDEERDLAIFNAKNYFEQAWPLNEEGKSRKGKLIECRPTDSNRNGLVTCSGYVVTPENVLTMQVRYAGYRKDIVGTSDVDMVKPN